MSGYGYIRDTVEETLWIRRVLIILMVLALVFGVLAGVFIEHGNRQADLLLGQFNQALARQDYAEAISLYRLAQEKALADSWLDRNQENYKSAVAEMETVAGQRLLVIETRLRAGKPLVPDDLAFIEGMGELSAARMIALLRSFCRDFLAGRIERAVLEAAFSQLSGMVNLHDAVSELPPQFDAMEAAQEEFKAALASLADADYWIAYEAFDQMLQKADWAGFIQEEAFAYLAECKSAMYGPLLLSARQLMEGGRYLSAQGELMKLAGVFPDDPVIQADLAACDPYIPAELVTYRGIIEMISIKPLIVDPAKAFDQDAYAATADESMMTTGEFSAMLEQLYDRDYVLIDATRIYNAAGSLAVLQIPAGKKPLVLVIEGLNYYASRRETGNCWNLVLDEGGEVSAEYLDSSGRMVVDRKGESIGILDEFVKQHPDFSLDGAKGTISLTGYECIFGLITDPDQLDDRNKALQDNGMPAESLTGQEIAANKETAKAIIKRLKETGWQFASSTYGFIDARNQSLDRIKTDTGKWKDQVGSLTGKVSMLNYPNGAFISGSDDRAIWLKAQGFILFTGLGATPYLYVGDHYIYMDKTPINGFSMRNGQTYRLDRFFDVSKVYDASVRPK